MTSNWNNFKPLNLDPLESTNLEHAQTTPNLTLNLTTIASPLEQGGGGGGGSSSGGGSGSFLGGLVHGIGEGIYGTYKGLFGMSQQQMDANIQAGGSGITGGSSVLGNLSTGISGTVKLAYQHPNVLLKLPGTMYSDFVNGNANTRGNMVGQAFVFLGTFAAGGLGVSKAGQLAGDMRDLSAASDATAAVATASSGVDGLATAAKIDGLIADSSKLGDLSSAARVDGLLNSAGRVGDFTGAARVDGLAGAARVDGLAGAGDSITARIAGSDGWAGRVLPREAGTDFLKASSLDLSGSTPSLTSRFWEGLKGVTSQGQGAVTRLFSRSTLAEDDAASTLATRWANPGAIGPAGGSQAVADTTGAARTAAGAEGLIGAGRTDSVLAELGRSDSLVTEAGRTGGLLADAGRTDSLLTGAGRTDSLLSNAGRTDSLVTGVGRTDSLFANAGRTDSLVTGVGRTDSLFANAGRTDSLVTGVGRTDSLFANAGRTDSVLGQLADTTTGITRETGVLRDSLLARGAEVPSSLPDLEQAAARLARATSTDDRLAEFSNVQKAASTVADQLPDESQNLTRLVDGLGSTVEDANRVSRLNSIAGSLSDQVGLVGKETDALKAILTAPEGSVPQSLTDLEQATTRFTQATSDAERTASLNDMQTAASRVAQQFPNQAATLTGTVDELGLQAQSANRLVRLDEAMSTMPAQVDQVVSQTTALKAAVTAGDGAVPQSLTNLEQATTRFAQATSDAERTASLTDMQTAASRVAAQFPDQAANLTKAVDDLSIQAQTASRLGRLDDAMAAMPFEANQVASETTALKAVLTTGGETVPQSVTDLEQATTRFTQATSDAERTASLTDMQTAASRFAAQFPDQAANLTKAVDDLSIQAQTASRLGRLDDAMAAMPFEANQVASETTALKAVLTTGGETVPQSVTDLEQATTRFTQATSDAERTASLTDMQTAASRFAAQFPDQAANLTKAVDDLSIQAQTASRLGRLDDAMAAMPFEANQVASETTALKAVLTTGGETVPQSVTDLEQATTRFTQATSDAERTASLTDMQTATARVAEQFPDQAANLTEAVDDLSIQAQTASRLGRLDDAMAAMPYEANQVASETTAFKAALTAGGDTVPQSVSDLEQATGRFTQATSDAERTASLTDMQTAAAKVAEQFPDQAANLTKAVSDLSVQAQTADRLAALDSSMASMVEKAGNVTEEAQVLQAGSGITAGSDASNALANIQRSADAFATLTNSTDRAEQIAQMSRNVDVVESAAGSDSVAGLRASITDLQGEAANADRLASLDQAVEQLPAKLDAVVAETSAPALQAAAAQSGTQAQAALSGIQQSATDLSTISNTTERAEQIAQMNKNMAVLEDSLGTDATQGLRASLSDLQIQSAQVDRLSALDGAVSQVSAGAGSISDEVAALRVANAGNQSAELESALNNLDRTAAQIQTSASLTQTPERFAQMNSDLSVVESELGETTAGGLRNAVAQVQAEAGTVERLTAVDESAAQVSAGTQAVAAETAALRAAAGAQASPEFEAALSNVDRAAAQVGTSYTSVGAAQNLGTMPSDMAAIEAQLGTGASARLQASMSDLDQAALQARTATGELIDYQGAKVTQGIAQLQEGMLASPVQVARLEQINQDLAVMKAVTPVDSSMVPAINNLEQQLTGVDAMSNIMAHPDVVKASAADLIKMAQSSDAGTAQAAADRLVLSGKAGKAIESPVAGLVSERQRFWLAQQEMARLQGVQKARMFESGKVLGLSVTDPAVVKLAGDAAIAGGGIAAAFGNARYNLSKINIMAQDILRNQEIKKAAADKSQSDSQSATAGQTDAAAQTASAAQAPAAQSSSPTLAGSDANVSPAASPNQISAGGGGGGGATPAEVSNQSTFVSNPDEAMLGAAIAAYAMPKFSLADETPSSQFPIYGADAWSPLARQYGGNPWGWARAPGAETTAEAGISAPQVVRRARAMGQPADPGLTKIAQARFPIPRIMSLTSQRSLLHNASTMSTGDRLAVGMGPGGMGTKSWQTTVDWSKIGGHHLANTESRGHDLRRLGPLEDGKEMALDGPGGGASGPNDPHQPGGQTLASQVGPGGLSVSVSGQQET